MKTRLRPDVQPLPSGAARERLRSKGQFWTPDWVADAMVSFVLADGSHELFDPAVGGGAFFRAARRASASVRLFGTDIAPETLRSAGEAGTNPADLRDLEIRDFVLDPPSRRFPAIIANPPYIRHHRLPRDAKLRLQLFCRTFLGHSIDGRAGLHVFFLLRALEHLTPGGRLAFIVSADICEGVFAEPLWRTLSQRFRIHAVATFAQESAPFPNVDTNALILFISNSPPEKTLVWARCETTNPDQLQGWVQSGFKSASAGIEVASRPLSEALKTGFSRRPEAASSGPVLGDFARVMRGIATGANEFFFLTGAQIEEHGLPQDLFLRAIGRTRDAQDDQFAAADLARLDRQGRPTYLLSLDGGAVSIPVRRYLDLGEKLGLPQRALIASRRPWFRMEERLPPPFLFAYLGRRNARFIRNRAGVVPLTGFLCIYPKPPYSAPELVDRLWQVLRDPQTQANLARVGKSYGAGAIKVEPRALERLPLPLSTVKAAGLANPHRAQLRLALP